MYSNFVTLLIWISRQEVQHFKVLCCNTIPLHELCSFFLSWTLYKKTSKGFSLTDLAQWENCCCVKVREFNLHEMDATADWLSLCVPLDRDTSETHMLQALPNLIGPIYPHSSRLGGDAYHVNWCLLSSWNECFSVNVQIFLWMW